MELKIKTGDYNLSFAGIGDLMGEFYGECLVGDNSDGTLVFEFADEDNIPKALKALECFPISGNYDWEMENDY